MAAITCNSCARCKEPSEDDRMKPTGFKRCSLLPVWHYVATNRAACEDYEAVAEQQIDDLAELF